MLFHGRFGAVVGRLELEIKNILFNFNFALNANNFHDNVKREVTQSSRLTLSYHQMPRIESGAQIESANDP